MKILDFGSLNLDYVYRVDHFVQPGETLHPLAMRIACGGKGLNQSIALARAGCEVFHAGRIGPDGSMLLDQLKEAGVDVHLVETVETKTGHAIIQVDRTGQNAILLFGGANRVIEKGYIDRVLKGFRKGDLVLLQNEISEVGYLIQKASERGLKVCFNASPADASLVDYPLHLVHTLFVNEIEGAVLAGVDDPDRIVDVLLSRGFGKEIVLTLGKRGVLYGDGTRKCRFKVFSVPVVDSTGAGDTFTGYFLAAGARGLDIDSSLLYATAASAICVTRSGASESIPTWEETAAFLSSGAMSGSPGKC
jgi:ribokinase